MTTLKFGGLWTEVALAETMSYVSEIPPWCEKSYERFGDSQLSCGGGGGVEVGETLTTNMKTIYNPASSYQWTNYT